MYIDVRVRVCNGKGCMSICVHTYVRINGEFVLYVCGLLGVRNDEYVHVCVCVYVEPSKWCVRAGVCVCVCVFT